MTTDQSVRLALDEDDQLAWKAISKLQARATRDVFESALPLTRSVAPRERATGVNILKWCEVPEREAVFLHLLRTDSSADVLDAAAAAFAQHPTPVVVPLLARLAVHPDWRVRHSVTLGMAGQEVSAGYRHADPPDAGSGGNGP